MFVHNSQSFCNDYKTVAVGAFLACGTLATVWAGKRVYKQRAQALEETKTRRTKDILSTNPRGSFLELISGQVYYEVLEPIEALGSHRKPLLVFVGHPSLRSIDLYRSLAEDLFHKGYHCLLFDFIGTGNSHYSAAGQTDYSLDGYTQQMKDILTELEFDRRPIFMISHSMSSNIAMAYITTYGREQVRKCVMLEPLIRDYAEGGKKVLARIPGISALLSCPPVSKYVRSNMVQWQLQAVFQGSKCRDNDVVRRHIESAMDQNRSFYASVWCANMRQLHSHLSKDRQFELLSRLKETMVDTIVLMTVDSPVNDRLKEWMPSATCVTIEDCDGSTGKEAADQIDRFFSEKVG